MFKNLVKKFAKTFICSPKPYIQILVSKNFSAEKIVSFCIISNSDSYLGKIEKINKQVYLFTFSKNERPDITSVKFKYENENLLAI